MYSQQPPLQSAFLPQYGSATLSPAEIQTEGLKVPAGFQRMPRRRVNFGAVILNVLAAPLLFTVAYGVMSFSLHYRHPSIVYPVCLVGMLFVVLFLIIAMQTLKKQKMGFTDRDPSWWIFGAVMLLIALVLGVVLGDLNFWYHMQPVYDVENLNAYPSVNPARERGGQLMDAGRVYFTDGSRLDFAKSMRFRNYDEYCVVPIVHGTEAPESFDFWAVGLNCCEGASSEFRCGEFNNPEARSGLRLMRDNQRPFFRLAVQQAEAAYGIKATHPQFYYWMQDPTAEVNSYRDDGYQQFIIGMFTHFSFNLLCVVLAVVWFSKYK